MSFLKYRAHPRKRADKPIPDTTNATKKPKPQKRARIRRCLPLRRGIFAARMYFRFILRFLLHGREALQRRPAFSAERCAFRNFCSAF